MIKCKLISNSNNELYLKEISLIDSLNNLSFDTRNLDTEIARKTALNTLEKAQKIKYIKGIADAYRNLGITNRLEGEYLESFNYYQ